MQTSGHIPWCGPCTILQKRCYKLSPPVRRKELAAAVRDGTLYAIPGLQIPAGFVPPPGYPVSAASVTPAKMQAAAAPITDSSSRAAQPASATCFDAGAGDTQPDAGRSVGGCSVAAGRAELLADAFVQALVESKQCSFGTDD